jgi:voltage-gated potassium channel
MTDATRPVAPSVTTRTPPPSVVGRFGSAVRCVGVGAAAQQSIERRHYALTGLRALLEAALVVVVYFVAPLQHHQRSYVVLRIVVGLAFFAALLAFEVRAIIRSKRPMLRAAVAMALVLPVFIVVFAWTYLMMSRSSMLTFGRPLSRVSALYFTVTVFSTVGFGDITPKTDAARLAVMVQMICDLAVIAVVFRLLLGAARGATDQRSSEVAADPPAQ